MKASISCAIGCAFALTAFPASATVYITTVDPGLALTQVHNNGNQSGDDTVGGDTTSGPPVGQLVLFQGSGDLSTNGFGYSQINGPFSSLHISLDDNTLAFEAIKFDLNTQGIRGANGVPAHANITANGGPGGPWTATNFLLTQGLDTFYIYGDNNELFSSFDLSFFTAANGTTPRDIDDIRHVDVSLATAVVINPNAGGVPEPATWMTMLVGFGTLGFAMRRGKYSARAGFAGS